MIELIEQPSARSDAPLLRKGDIVSIRATVKSDQLPDGQFVLLAVDGHYQDLYLSPDNFTLVQPRIVINDRVRKDGLTFVVMAISGDRAWLHCDRPPIGGETDIIAELSGLDRVCIQLPAAAE